jgi:hypothetical protein
MTAPKPADLRLVIAGLEARACGRIVALEH